LHEPFGSLVGTTHTLELLSRFLQLPKILPLFLLTLAMLLHSKHNGIFQVVIASFLITTPRPE
jgi:hypothetical protein